MKDFFELEAAKVALDLVDEVYRLCAKLPHEEKYGLVSQMKKAVSSIVANLAEGYGRYTYADKASRYVIARGERMEVVAYLHIAVRVHYLEAEEVRHALELADRTGKLISGLIASCRDRARTCES